MEFRKSTWFIEARRVRIPAAMIFIICVSGLSSHAQVADGKCKFLGNIIAASVPSDFDAYWNQVTPENAGKWGSVEATRDQMVWAPLDRAYNHARENGLPFKQHTLVWGQQLPAWIAELSADEQREEVEEWIREFCERYPDTDFIDVVNEPLHAPPVYAAAIGGQGLTGWEWVVWAFEKAREYCPNAKLILNDYNIVSSTLATTEYVRLIELLKSEGLIDIIGEQGHFLETTPLNTIKENLDKLGDTGLPIHISEFDVNIADDAAQKARYEELFPVLWNHRDVEGVTLWGYKQGQIWRTDAYLLRSDGSERPAMTWLKQYVPTTVGGTFCITSNEEESFAIDVYPNPTKGRIRIEFGNGRYFASIRDVHGRECWLEEDASGILDVDLQQPPGMYLLEVRDGFRTYNRKIIIR